MNHVWPPAGIMSNDPLLTTRMTNIRIVQIGCWSTTNRILSESRSLFSRIEIRRIPLRTSTLSMIHVSINDIIKPRSSSVIDSELVYPSKFYALRFSLRSLLYPFSSDRSFDVSEASLTVAIRVGERNYRVSQRSPIDRLRLINARSPAESYAERAPVINVASPFPLLTR